MARRDPIFEHDAAAGPDAPRIRTMVIEDLDQVMAIERASFPSPWSATTISNLLQRDNARLFAAVDANDRVLGYAAVWFAGGNGELGSIAVEPTRRGQGLGGLLLTAVLDEARARAVTHLYLEVRDANLVAQRLYQRRGFETVGRRKNYYKHPVEDALVMRRLLPR